ncbi:MAG: TatD family hydrolase [Alphaproteobacteria bacterium]
MLVDSHCHLHFPQFKDDITEIFKKSEESRVGSFLTVGTSVGEITSIIDLCTKYPNVFGSLGIHPHHAVKETADIFHNYLSNPKIIAIGEIGIDLYKNPCPLKQQIKVFEEQLEIASTYNLPIIIHMRDSFSEVMDVLKDYKTLRGVFHCFTSDRAAAQQILDLGFYISFSGIITFKNAKDICDVVHYVPNDRFLVETDAPFLAPHPYRGRRNEPAFVKYVAIKIAEIKNKPLDDIASYTENNFFALFSRAKSIANSL